MNLLLKTLIAAVLAFSASMTLADEFERSLVIENHRFDPVELRVPAGKKIKLMVENKDTTPEEFESHDLNREKVVPPKSRVSIFIGPLKAGRYAFMGEFHADLANGTVIAED